MRPLKRVSTFLSELKRRKVFRVGSIYLVAAWGASLGVAELFPAFGVPDWVVRAFVITAALGFPFVLVLAWAFEITPEGVVLDPGDNQPAPAKIPTHLAGDSTTTWLASETVRVRWHYDTEEVMKEFSKSFVIGRDADAEVRLLDNRISRLHAKVIYEDGRWWIVDLSSRNGTRLNGHMLTERQPLEESNVVVLCDDGAPIRLVLGECGDETVLDKSNASC